MKALLLFLSSAALLLAQDFTGSWLGTLEAGAIKLRIGMEITSKDGKLAAEMISLDQGNSRVPVATMDIDGRKLKLSMPVVNGTYEGELAPLGDTITGKLTQGGFGNPLNLKRVAEIPKPKRSQIVAPPFPYNSEDLTFPSAALGVQMAGTLTTPKSKGPFPAVILVSGSGRQNRDEELLDHKPFLIISDHLTKAGYAVLRYDDRGVGKSTGTFDGSTTADFAKDTAGAVAFLRNRKDIDATKIFIAGHSEGGLIAPMVAAEDPKLAGIILLAGPGVSGEKIMELQAFASPRAAGMPADQVERVGKSTIDAVKKRIDSDPWIAFFWKYDPAPTIAKVKCPILALNGALDTQVNADQNLDAIEAATKAGGNTRVTLSKLANMNHLFQTTKTGAPSEYMNNEETFSPIALTEITRWLNSQTAKR